MISLIAHGRLRLHVPEIRGNFSHLFLVLSRLFLNEYLDGSCCSSSLGRIRSPVPAPVPGRSISSFSPGCGSNLRQTHLFPRSRNGRDFLVAVRVKLGEPVVGLQRSESYYYRPEEALSLPMSRWLIRGISGLCCDSRLRSPL